MISYIKEDNIIYAYFGNLTDNDDAFLYWYRELIKYFNKYCKSVPPFIITNIVDDVLCECKFSGMKFYGEAKCHPNDEFSYNIGWHIARNRLLDKYLRVRARIASKIRMNIYKDYYSLGKLSKKDRKKGW